MFMKIKNILKLIIAIAICQLIGNIGTIFTISAISTWYVTLQKPSFTPPNWLFGPVWTTLFTLIGISLYLVWNKGLENKNVKSSIFIFFLQLVLNVFWSFLFFGLKFPFYAFIEIIILWIAIAVTIFKFYNVSKKAGLIIIPYLVWVSVALALNYYVWILNP